MIKLDAVSKKQDEFEIKNVSLKIEESEILTVIGPNGAGKSTLLKLMTNTIKPDSGSITDIQKTELSVLFDKNKLPLELSINDYRKILPSFYKFWDEQYFDRLIDRFGLPENKKIGAFSKGMLKKFNISVALASKPKYILCDELTSDLDPVVRIDILQVIREYVKENQALAVLTTHILEDILTVSDKLAY